MEKIEQHRAIVDALGGRLLVGASRSVDDARNIVTGLGLRLESINPQRVLERGYSIVRVKGKNVRSIAEVSEGDGMDISVSDGLVVGTVTGRSKER
jgi:exodeoxyribonuclease VII large subunit